METLCYTDIGQNPDFSPLLNAKKFSSTNF